MEYVIFDRRQSVCCREGEIFRKYFKYADKYIAEHEGKYSRLYENLGINTPHFMRTSFSAERGLFFNEYCYVDIQPLNETNFDELLFQKILDVLNRIYDSKLLCDDGVKFWNQHYKADLIYALNILKNYVEVDIDSLLQKVLEQEISVVMHGDFSLSNMAVLDKNLYLYDFASAGCAPKWWDLGYLIASLSTDLGKKLYKPLCNKNLLDCIKLVAAVRFGRALRKQEDIKKRQNIFKYWSELSS